MRISHNQRKLVWGGMVIVVVILSLLPSDQIPVAVPFSDKAAHLFTYFILTFVALLASNQKHSVLTILALQILIGVGVEGAQSFIPGRTPELLDVLANSIGVMFGALLYFLFRKIKPKTQN